MANAKTCAAAVAIALAFGPVSAVAGQLAADDPSRSEEEGMRAAARRAGVGMRDVGQRQTPAIAAPGVEPMDRIDNRIQTRIESRIHTRVDREYEDDSTSTTAIAGAQSRLRATTVARPRPRGKGR